MNKKVNLRELVATKIIYGLMLVLYYWMWSRTNWENYYSTIQTIFGLIFVIFFLYQGYRTRKYKSENKDELAEKNLRKCDSICLKIMLISLIILSFGIAIFSHSNELNISSVGWIIVLLILLISIIRTVLFIVMDKKGI